MDQACCFFCCFTISIVFYPNKPMMVDEVGDSQALKIQ